MAGGAAILFLLFCVVGRFAVPGADEAPAPLPLRRTGRETTQVMPETTIPTSLVFATLMLHLSTPGRYHAVMVEARSFLRKLVSKLASTSPPGSVELVVCNLTDFTFRTVAIFDDGSIDGALLWGAGSQISSFLKHKWQQAP